MATECILIRYGELFLKGNNKGFFESTLIRNIKSSLAGLDYKFIKAQGRFFVEDFQDPDKEEVLSRLRKVFGIHNLSPARKVKSDLDEISRAADDLVPKEGKFRVTVKRADKRFPLNSMSAAAEIGGRLLDASPLRMVDLYHFDFELNVDIRENGYSYLFYEKISGAEGLPTGTGGKAMLLLSGGIDSPVAAYKIAKRGVKLCCVHYHSFPYTSELALQKVKDLAEKISAYATGLELFVVPFTEIQYAIHENCPAEFMITIMRRFMMRIAERLAKENHCGALVTGESLGQVASQTMESIQVTNSVVSLPVFRPLIGDDKSEIITIAEKLDTFQISIRPYEDCCTVFLPKNPVIHPKIGDAERFEQKLDIEALIESAIARTEKTEYRN